MDDLVKITNDHTAIIINQSILSSPMTVLKESSGEKEKNIHKLYKNNNIQKGQNINQALKGKNFKIKYSKWTSEEDFKLKEIIFQTGTKNWDKISEYFPGKCARQCIYRWYKVINPSLKSENWDEQEDSFIINYISRYGVNNWTMCAKLMNTGRTPKNCKERWYNFLSLNQKSEIYFSPKDDLTLLILVNKYGTSWSKIVKHFQKKTENNLKNRCYSILRKFAKENKHTKEISDLKTDDIIIYLPIAIETLRRRLGEDIYQNICSSFQQKNFTETLPSITTSCTNSTPCNLKLKQKVVSINLCNNCKNKLREQLKKKIITKMIQNQINNLCSNPIDFSINLDLTSDLNNVNNRMINTSTKIDSIKDILKNFIENVA